MKAISNLKNGKAAPNDGIMSKMVKALEDIGVKKITELCNKIFSTGVIPSDLNESIFFRFPKKAKATNCNEYRT